jgi:ribosomal protein L7/L12
MSTSERYLVVLAGWNVGLRTIDLMKLVRERTAMNLAEAKRAVERLVDGEQVAISFLTADEAERFLEDAAETGAVVRYGS